MNLMTFVAELLKLHAEPMTSEDCEGGSVSSWDVTVGWGSGVMHRVPRNVCSNQGLNGAWKR